MASKGKAPSVVRKQAVRRRSGDPNRLSRIYVNNEGTLDRQITQINEGNEVKDSSTGIDKLKNYSRIYVYEDSGRNMPFLGQDDKADTVNPSNTSKSVKQTQDKSDNQKVSSKPQAVRVGLNKSGAGIMSASHVIPQLGLETTSDPKKAPVKTNTKDLISMFNNQNMGKKFVSQSETSSEHLKHQKKECNKKDQRTCNIVIPSSQKSYNTSNVQHSLNPHSKLERVAPKPPPKEYPQTGEKITIAGIKSGYTDKVIERKVSDPTKDKDRLAVTDKGSSKSKSLPKHVGGVSGSEFGQKPVIKPKPKPKADSAIRGLHPLVCQPLIGLIRDKEKGESISSHDSGFSSIRNSEKDNTELDDNQDDGELYENADELAALSMQRHMCQSIEDLTAEDGGTEYELGDNEGQMLTRYIQSGSTLTFEEYQTQQQEISEGGTEDCGDDTITEQLKKMLALRNINPSPAVTIDSHNDNNTESDDNDENTPTTLKNQLEMRNKNNASPRFIEKTVDEEDTFERMHKSLQRQSHKAYYNLEEDGQAELEDDELLSDGEDDDIYEAVEYGSRVKRQSRKVQPVKEGAPVLLRTGLRLTVPQRMTVESTIEAQHGDYDDWYGWSDFDDSDDDSVNGDQEESEDQPRDRLYHIVEELLETEKKYVCKLEILTQARQTAEATNKDAKDIFPYIEGIYKLHKDDLLPQLRDRVQYWDNNPQIGDIVKSFAPFLKIYTDYVKNFNKSLHLVENLMEKSTEFSTAINNVCDELCDDYNMIRLGIKAHMLEPVQRVPRYKLLLLDYFKHLPEDCDPIERSNIQDAVKLVSEAAEHFEYTINQTAEFGCLMDLEKQIDGPHSIVTAGRKLVKEGPMLKCCVRTDKLDQRYLFLFNDLLLICKEKSVVMPGSAKYMTRQSLHTDGMKIYEGTNLDIPNTFLLKTKQKTLELVAENQEEKAEWQQALWQVVGDGVREKLNKKSRYSVRTMKATVNNVTDVSENKLGKVSPVWVKNKDVTMCMLCANDFSTFLRRHHCRACGAVICGKCSSQEAKLEYDDFREHRVCDECFKILSENPSNNIRMRRTNKLRKRSQELCLRNGFVNISTNDGRTWNRRYCEVHEGGMFYTYKASQDLKPYSCEDLGKSQASIGEHSQPMVVRLKIGDDTEYLLKEIGKIPDDIIKWKAAFDSAKDDAHRTRFLSGVQQPTNGDQSEENNNKTSPQPNSPKYVLKVKDTAQSRPKSPSSNDSTNKLPLAQTDSNGYEITECVKTDMENEYAYEVSSTLSWSTDNTHLETAERQDGGVDEDVYVDFDRTECESETGSKAGDEGVEDGNQQYSVQGGNSYIVINESNA